METFSGAPEGAPRRQLLTSSEVKLMETFWEEAQRLSMETLNFFWSEINGNNCSPGWVKQFTFGS